MAFHKKNKAMQSKALGLFILKKFNIFLFQYKYRDLTVQETISVITQYKDLKPVMDAYGELVHKKNI